MSEVRRSGAASVWAQAVNLLRGGDTAALVERFTQEVTLVAEGLCEDQARLRRIVEGLNSRSQEEQERIAESLKSMDMRLTELSVRMAELERKRMRRWLPGSWMIGGKLRLAAFLGGTALLTAVLRLFR